MRNVASPLRATMLTTDISEKIASPSRTFRTNCRSSKRKTCRQRYPERFHKPRWQWRGAGTRSGNRNLSRFTADRSPFAYSKNSRIDGFKAERAFACIVASEETGAIWCGHQYCPPVGTRKLKSTIPWSLQLCRIYCVRNDIYSDCSSAELRNSKFADCRLRRRDHTISC